MSHESPREYEVIEESSINWQLKKEGLLVCDRHVAALGQSKIEVVNIRLSAEGMKWIEANKPQNKLYKALETVFAALVKFGWFIVPALIGLVVWYFQQGLLWPVGSSAN